MKYLYARVSSQNQNLKRQQLLKEKYNVDKIFEEKVSGKNTDRPKLQLLLEIVDEGDTVVCESYSRLSRSTKDLLDIVEEL